MGLLDKLRKARDDRDFGQVMARIDQGLLPRHEAVLSAIRSRLVEWDEDDGGVVRGRFIGEMVRSGPASGAARFETVHGDVRWEYPLFVAQSSRFADSTGPAMHEVLMEVLGLNEAIERYLHTHPPEGPAPG